VLWLQGLEDQLLGDVVRKERPELEEAKDRLVVSLSNDKRTLQELEDKVGWWVVPGVCGIGNLVLLTSKSFTQNHSAYIRV
jgi:hypothetical protein